jgi:hypothetical protein
MKAKKQSKQESLDRLLNQYLQAQTSGDTNLAKKIKVIIDRIKSKKD